MASAEQNPDGQKGLGVFDAISIIIGIVIGTTIFKLPTLIFLNCSDPWMGLSVWLFGGILALIGALCYAELAATYPQSGGDYYYLSRAFGPHMGFLFGWAQLLVVIPVSIGTMAVVFGEYATKIPFVKDLEKQVDLKNFDTQIGQIGLEWDFVLSCLAVIVFTILHLFGLLVGKITQDFLTVVKIVSLLAILVAGFGFAKSQPGDWRLDLPETTPMTAIVEGGKEADYQNDNWDVHLTLKVDEKEGSKLLAKFKSRKDKPQKLDLKLRVQTNKDAEVAPDVIEVKKDYPLVPADSEYVFSLPGRDAERTGIYSVEQVLKPTAFPGWEALALILVMYAFGGWNDAAFVAAEVRNPQRNIPRALIIGVTLITVVYLLINTAYLMGLGFAGCRDWGVPSRLLENAVVTGLGEGWKGWGEITMSILIVISALGAVSGLIFTGARVYATLGNDYPLFGWMGHWQPGKRAPILALLVQMIITLGMLFMLGTTRGHAIINDLLEKVHIQHTIRWSADDAFTTLFSHAAPVFWTFFLLTGISLFMLRSRDAGMTRPFSVPFYPWLPIIFCNSCVFMLYRATIYVEWGSLFAFALVLIGIPIYLLARLVGYRGETART